MIINQPLIKKLAVVFFLFFLQSCEVVRSSKKQLPEPDRLSGLLMTLINQEKYSDALSVIQQSRGKDLDKEFYWNGQRTCLLNQVCYLGGNLEGPISLVDALLAKGCNVNHVIDTQFPLGISAGANNIEVMKILLMHGARKNLRNRQGETAYDIAFSNYHAEASELLKQKKTPGI